MDENARQRELGYVLDEALKKLAGAAEYSRSRRAATNRRASPIPPDSPGFVKRVARLLSPL